MLTGRVNRAVAANCQLLIPLLSIVKQLLSSSLYILDSEFFAAWMDPSAALLTWFNSISEEDPVFDVIELRDGYAVAKVLASFVGLSPAGVVPSYESRFNPRLRANNLKRVVIFLEEFYSRLFRRRIEFRCFHIENMATGTESAPFILLLQLGMDFSHEYHCLYG